MSEQLFQLLPQAVVYLVLVVFVVGFLGSQFAQASEGFAKLIGPLGKFWRRKQEDERRERKETIRNETRDFIQTVMHDIKPPDYESLKRQLVNVLERVAEMEQTEQINTAYLIQDAEWHRETDMKLAEAGLLTPPLPARLPYTEFARKWQTGWRPE